MLRLRRLGTMNPMFVISLGGSIVVPDEVDIPFIRNLRGLFFSYLEPRPQEKLILVVGGGAPARKYQEAYRDLSKEKTPSAQDWIGIMATRLNAELVRHAMERYCTDPVVTDPTADFVFSGRILVAAGWKPGFSTDFDAVTLAERFGADTVVNLSNIDKVYSADPKVDSRAVPLDSISWSDFRKLVGTNWSPGSNLPFDPVATKKAAELNLRVVVAGGRDLENLSKLLTGGSFRGTQIGPG